MDASVRSQMCLTLLASKLVEIAVKNIVHKIWRMINEQMKELVVQRASFIPADSKRDILSASKMRDENPARLAQVMPHQHHPWLIHM